MNCKNCKYLTEYGCTVISICKRHELLKTLPKHIQESALDRYEKKETK